jgi:uncharacterized protein (DUF1800 family)
MLLGGWCAAGPAQAACSFDVAFGNSTADPLRDGVLLMRYAKGQRGAALVAGTTAIAADVESRIAARTALLDLNGNGVFDIDDAAVIGRSLVGFKSDAWLPDGRAGAFATRTDKTKLKAFVDAGCPTTGATTAPTAAHFEAARFLIQSTFGPSRTDIDSFVALSNADHAARASAWITAQMATPRAALSHYQYVATRKPEYAAVSANFGSEMAREAFWAQALTGRDQLRQRVAFALSQILVVSSQGDSDNPFELAGYLDLLANNAFGNYRDILYQVALSPAMGRYLSHLKNDGSNSNPNENFAREVLQLFSVGLFMLQPDGQKTLSQIDGLPIPTYDEPTVKGFARVFTGLSYDDPYCRVGDPAYAVARASCSDGSGDVHPTWNWYPDNEIYKDLGFVAVDGGWARPMVTFPGRHNPLSKQLLTYNYANPVAACVNALAAASSGGLLPAINTTNSPVTTRTKVTTAQANAVINAAIDNVFCHPNVGPFISKNLIKLLVTSTPSTGYVQRVADAFNNNGGGIRGDMQAVIRAIFLDSEAAQSGVTPPANFGKLKEPMLRLSAIFRAFNATSISGRYQLLYGLDDVDSGISQGPLQSPTVFNYYHPEFAPPGPVAAGGATGPEFEITTTTAIASTQNYLSNLVTYVDNGSNNAFSAAFVGRFGCNINVVSSTNPTTSSRQHCQIGDLSDLYTLHADANALFDHLNLLLMGGSLSTANKATLVNALNAAFTTVSPPAPLAGNPPTATQLNTYNTAVSNWQNYKRDRVRGALWLTVHAPEFQIQR